MAARVTALLLLIAVITGVGLWGWSNYCEQYDLCYPACRVASNDVEYWKSAPAVNGKSEWLPAGTPPGSECLGLLPVMRRQNPGKLVEIDYVNLANERKPAPFYQYDCVFDVKEPVFNLARNKECVSRKAQ
jgi:hypothetical protein